MAALASRTHDELPAGNGAVKRSHSPGHSRLSGYKLYGAGRASGRPATDIHSHLPITTAYPTPLAFLLWGALIWL